MTQECHNHPETPLALSPDVPLKQSLSLTQDGLPPLCEHQVQNIFLVRRSLTTGLEIMSLGHISLKTDVLRC